MRTKQNIYSSHRIQYEANKSAINYLAKRRSKKPSFYQTSDNDKWKSDEERGVGQRQTGDVDIGDGRILVPFFVVAEDGGQYESMTGETDDTYQSVDRRHDDVQRHDRVLDGVDSIDGGNVIGCHGRELLYGRLGDGDIVHFSILDLITTSQSL